MATSGSGEVPGVLQTVEGAVVCSWSEKVIGAWTGVARSAGDNAGGVGDLCWSVTAERSNFGIWISVELDWTVFELNVASLLCFEHRPGDDEFVVEFRHPSKLSPSFSRSKTPFSPAFAISCEWFESFETDSCEVDMACRWNRLGFLRTPRSGADRAGNFKREWFEFSSTSRTGVSSRTSPFTSPGSSSSKNWLMVFSTARVILGLASFGDGVRGGVVGGVNWLIGLIRHYDWSIQKKQNFV